MGGGALQFYIENPKSRRCSAQANGTGPRSRWRDWEGDTVVSSASPPVLVTLAERKSGLVRIRKVARATAREVSSAMIKVFWRLPNKLRQTLTLDNGAEHSRWRSIERYSGIKVFFAHPYHSWERGTNENTNGLIYLS